MEEIILNHFKVDNRLAKLMRRSEWAMSRGKRKLFVAPHIPNSESWLQKFKSSTTLETDAGIFAIGFFGIDQAIMENRNIRRPDLAILFGKKNTNFPPGDFDPASGYIIGMTCEVDEGIFVDLRPAEGPIITYSNHGPEGIVTAFHSIDSFIEFYYEQHGL